MSERTIIIADDNSPLREAFVQQLREYYRVHGVGSGDALLDELTPSVDAVVCDWKLGGIQKEELLDAIQRTGRNPAIIVVSGCPPQRDLGSQGVTECLQKPIKIDTLRETIGNAIENQSSAVPPRV